MGDEKVEVSAKLPIKTMFWIALAIFGGTAVTSGGTNILQSMALRAQPVPIEVTSPQMETVVEESLAPVKAMITDHANEFAHPHATREFEDIDARFIRQDRKMDKIETNLGEATETINRLAGQVEILVDLQSIRLGVPR